MLAPSPERVTRVEAEAEAIACGVNPRHFLQHVKILDQADGIIPFEPWPHLLELLDTFETHRFVVVLKARQLGVSWLVAAYVLWLAKYQQGANILLLSQGEKEAAKLLRKVRHIEDNLPPWLRWAREKDSDSELTFPDVLSTIAALPATQKAGRSEGATLVVPDEFAFHEYGAENMTALLPTVRDKGRMIVVSTANGMAGHFHDLYRDAEARGFHRVFYPWHVHPGRDADWYDAARRADPDNYQQEYPATAEEAFLQSGRPVFPGVERDPTIVPLARRVRDIPAETIVYRLPRAGARYVIGADVALGKAHSDHSCAVVLELDESGQGIEAAHLCGLWPPDLFALLLDSLAQFYGARLAVERNNHGVAVLDYLRQLIADRSRTRIPQRYVLHHGQDPLKAPTSAAVTTTHQVAGWWTSASSKAMMLLELEAALRQRAVRFGTPEMLAELLAYQRADDGTMDAPDGHHDDRVMAFAIAWQMHKWAGTNPYSVAHLPSVRVSAA